MHRVGFVFTHLCEAHNLDHGEGSDEDVGGAAAGIDDGRRASPRHAKELMHWYVVLTQQLNSVMEGAVASKYPFVRSILQHVLC